MLGWDFEVDVWSRFWRWDLLKICVWTYLNFGKLNSTLGWVVPLAMFTSQNCCFQLKHLERHLNLTTITILVIFNSLHKVVAPDRRLTPGSSSPSTWQVLAGECNPNLSWKDQQVPQCTPKLDWKQLVKILVECFSYRHDFHKKKLINFWM